MRVALIAQPYNVQGKGQGHGSGPEALIRAGIADRLTAQGHTVQGPATVTLTPDEEARYGGWNRVGMANGCLAGLVAAARLRPGGVEAGGSGVARDTRACDSVNAQPFVVALGADCNSVLGILGGLARSVEPEWPRRVGLVWIDAHADYNTPETSPSGMLGGMPVATACGKCLPRLRRASGLRVPLQAPDVLMVGLRDVDPPEQEAIKEDGIVTLTVDDLLQGEAGSDGSAWSPRLKWAMDRLCAREDVVYVHVDLDILDPTLAPAAGLPAPGGISGDQLGEGLRRLLSYPKVGALALVSYGAERDEDGRTLDQVMRAALGATQGLTGR